MHWTAVSLYEFCVAMFRTNRLVMNVMVKVMVPFMVVQDGDMETKRLVMYVMVMDVMDVMDVMVMNVMGGYVGGMVVA